MKEVPGRELHCLPPADVNSGDASPLPLQLLLWPDHITDRRLHDDGPRIQPPLPAEIARNRQPLVDDISVDGNLTVVYDKARRFFRVSAAVGLNDVGLARQLGGG